LNPCLCLKLFAYSAVPPASQGYSPTIDWILSRFTIALLGFSLFCCVPGLRTFGTERLVFLHREAPAGLSPLGYVTGRVLWDSTLGLWLYPAIFGGFYYILTTFRVRSPSSLCIQINPLP